MTLELTLAGIAMAAALGADPGSGAAGAQPNHVEERVVIINDDGPGPGHDMHGPITRQQWVEKHTAMFDQLDTNHDGKLSPEEMMAGHHMMMRMHGHGGPGDHPPMMMIDHDGPPPGDGDEVEIRHEGPDGPGERHVIILRHHGGPGEFDTNKDGKLSFEEFAAPLRKVFDEMDTNHDGFIDKAEQEAAHHGHGDHGDMPPPPPHP